jgi:hypothetical protein
LADKLGLVVRKDEIAELISRERLLDAAELVRHEATKLNKLQDMHKAIRLAVDGPVGDSFPGSEWHETLVRLEPNVIVTTNYDKIIERATNSGYQRHTYRSGTGLAADIRRGDEVLLKIHGTVDDIEQIILTRTDYTRVRVEGRESMEVLQALFMTHPALFLGYGLRDPDIQLLLENVLGARGSAPPHYMLAPNSMPDFERDVLQFSYGVTVIPYDASNHGAGLELLKELASLVENSAP